MIVSVFIGAAVAVDVREAVVEGVVTVAVVVRVSVGVTIGSPILLKQTTTSAKSMRPLLSKSNRTTGSSGVIPLVWFKNVTTLVMSILSLTIRPAKIPSLPVQVSRNPPSIYQNRE